MAMTERVTEVLSKHGWPPAALVVVFLTVGALFVLYRDHRENQEKYYQMSQANLEANLLATAQRNALQDLLTRSMTAQEYHLRTIQDMEKARLQQNQLDQQLTGAAIQALRQISNRLDIQLQIDRPEEILQQQQ